MNKVSIPADNAWCPQPLYLYGTYKADGTPDFGLFCWFGYAWTEGLAAMACIGSDKLTRERILETGVFSANLVTESILPLADYFGAVNGYDPEKMGVPFSWGKGEKLNVPILEGSPVCHELEVRKTLPANGEGSILLLCDIRNTLTDPALLNESVSAEDRLRHLAPVVTAGHEEYFSWQGRKLGDWHGLARSIRPDAKLQD